MMYLQKLKITPSQKRVVLVEMTLSNEPVGDNEHYYIVGELPHYDDAVIKLKFDMKVTFKYLFEQDAIEAFNKYGEL